MNLTARTSWKNQFYHYESASKFHNSLRQIFITDMFFKQLQCFQEVLVKDLVPAYTSPYDAVDWYIDEYNIIIELHGIQHYKIQSFGSKDSYWNQKKNFHNIKYRDNRKKTALLDAGYSFLELSYKDCAKVTPEYLKHKIFYES